MTAHPKEKYSTHKIQIEFDSSLIGNLKIAIRIYLGGRKKRTVSREDTLFGAERGALYSIDTCEKALPRYPGTLSFTIPSPIIHLSNLPLTFAAALAEVDINHPG